ncbi:MAG: Na+/H+ antiporter [Abitibacteriaceae bacterium]|nr:Na+/H+ antiporter [Abditibacteriaceae bacterium]MBV9868326.1 Na+/H+ antiporter [Abditibacteriaceae bacterium]
MSHDALTSTQYFWLILIAFLVALVARRVQVPYALALVMTGLIVGIPHLLPHTHLDPKLLFSVFLPPLLFESAIQLPLVHLRRNWKAITVYTFGGTILSTFIAGSLAAGLLHWPLTTGLLFGALISATDPISVIAIFKRLGAGRRLTLLVEAESLFNDGVAVVLFTVMLALGMGQGISPVGSILQFCQLVIGGALLGVTIGMIASRVHCALDDHLLEITLTSVVAFGAYLGAEALHVSGVIAVVAAGLVVGNYGMPNSMSPGTRLAVRSFWEYASFVVNSIVFLLIGIEVSYVQWADKIGAVLLAIIIVLVGRTAIYPLSWLVNRMNTEPGREIPLSWQHIMVWGGLRGALSMALVLGLDQNFPYRDILVACTFGVVLASLLLQGLTVGALLRQLGLAQTANKVSDEQRRLAGEIVACEAAIAELDKLKEQDSYPNTTVESLLRHYQERLNQLQETMQTLYPQHDVLQEEQASKARRAALLAAKSAFQESERRGWLEAEDWQDIAAHIDTELVELT